MPDLDTILSAGHALALPGLLLVIAWQQFINHRQGKTIMSLLEKFGPVLDQVEAIVRGAPLHDELLKASATIGELQAEKDARAADEDAFAARLAQHKETVAAMLNPPAPTAEPQPEQPAA